LRHARYEAGEVLGGGAQGVVGRVVDREAPDLLLCAKVWRPDAFREQALLGEFALLSRLRVPGVVRAHDLGRDERSGAPFIVEEYVEGEDAAAWVASAPPEARNERLAVVIGEVARALAWLHDAGFVHSDLKPAHVRRRKAGRSREGSLVALLDLGAAVSRARAKGAGNGSSVPVSFTRSFAAPEVLAGGAPTPASDLYGLGALAWAIAAGAGRAEAEGPPAEEARRGRRKLREAAPWVQPSLAELIEVLIKEHPRDRPEGAREVLRKLGAATLGAGVPLGAPAAPVGRERELAALLEAAGAAEGAGAAGAAEPAGAAAPRVRYVTGPSGSGKSHLLRELVTRALLAGRSVRPIAFPRDGDPIVPRLVAFLRGIEGAWPFVTSERDERPLLLVLDELDRAPAELVAALDAYRCRAAAPRRLDIVAAARAAPDGASAVELGPLSDESFEELCATLGIEGEARIREARTASGKNPGWLVASLGRVPLTRDTALARVRELSASASALLAAIAIAGGALPEAICIEERWGADAVAVTRASSDAPTDAVTPADADAPIGELLAASLITRSDAPLGATYALTAPALARDLAAALASFRIVDRVAEALLRAPRASARALLETAAAPFPPARRADLCAKASARARAEGARSDEIDALLALAAEPARRTPEILCRLERLTRDAGAVMGAKHPHVLGWLDEAGLLDDRVHVLALRRRAEQSARDGNTKSAREQAEQALAAARRIGDPAAEAYSMATLGLVALFRAEWGEAERWLKDARSRIAAGTFAEDAEETARLDHNAGVVAIYRGRIDDAVATFERSLAVKRSLGDRAGMRSCLMNLGMALGKAGRFDEARAALDEAMKLARSLGQLAGRGWCLFARAEIEIRRGDARAAASFIDQARALDEALPAAIRADLVILSAHVALLDGDGARALAALRELDARARAEDPLIDTRARLAEAGAYLAKLPAEPRRAARLAIAAARVARAAMLGEMEAQAIAVLRSARSARSTRSARSASSTRSADVSAKPRASAAGYSDLVANETRADDALWTWLASAAASGSTSETAAALARLLIQRSGAERALLAIVDPEGRVLEAWGADLDGLEIAQASQRIDPELARTAVAQRAPVYKRDAETPGGRGSRLAVASPDPQSPSLPRALLVLEHRFYTGRFDAVTAAEAERWATLAALLARLHRAADAADAAAPDPRAPRAPHAIEAPPPRGDSARAPALVAAPPSGMTTRVPSAEPRRSFPDILGESPALRRALAKLDAAIDSDLPVLLVGETGTGKELFARALHELGPRGKRELVAINCGAVPDALFEAELFGHARGSFTGAERARPGLLAPARPPSSACSRRGATALSGATRSARTTSASWPRRTAIWSARPPSALSGRIFCIA
jgi:tetratricopeptide (TPR) repeat protein